MPTQFNASDMGEEGVMRRLKLDYDGNLRLYSLDDATGSWRATWAALPQQCDVHSVCGRYGVCAYQPLPGAGPTLACSCSEGFVARQVRRACLLGEDAQLRLLGLRLHQLHPRGIHADVPEVCLDDTASATPRSLCGTAGLRTLASRTSSSRSRRVSRSRA